MYVSYAKEMGFTGFTANVTHRDGVLRGLEVGTQVPTYEDAQEIAAKFPKSIKIKATTISGTDGVFGWVSMRLYFDVNGVTGERNESAIKRARNFLKTCDKLGLIVRFDQIHYLNQITNREEFEAKLAAL
jgi:hypothetical protein